MAFVISLDVVYEFLNTSVLVCIYVTPPKGSNVYGLVSFQYGWKKR